MTHRGCVSCELTRLSSCVQLENTLGGDQVYQQRVTQHLIPCVGQFSVALADDTQWKTLNYQILLKTRHANAKVRTSTHTFSHHCALGVASQATCRLPLTT